MECPRRTGPRAGANVPGQKKILVPVSLCPGKRVQSVCNYFFSYFRIFLFCYQISLPITFPISLSDFTTKLLGQNLITKWDMDCPRQTRPWNSKIVLWYVQKSMIQVRSQVNNFFWIEIAKYYNKPFLVWVGKKGFCSSKVAMVQPIPYCTNVVLSRNCTGCYIKMSFIPSSSLYTLE